MSSITITRDNFVRVEYFSTNPRDSSFVTIFFNNGAQILFDRETGILSTDMGYANELNSKDRTVLNSMIDSFVHLNQNDMIYEKGASSPFSTSPIHSDPPPFPFRTLPTPTSPKYSRFLALRRSQSSPLGGGSKKKKKKRGNTKLSRQKSRKNRNKNKNKRNRL